MKIGGDTIEVVDEFVCLGTCINKHKGELADIRTGQQCTAVPTPNNEVKTDT
jgi:hypothetical protein